MPGGPQLIHSAPQMRQSNGCSPFAQERLAPLSFGSGPFPHRQRLCDALTPGVLMTTAPLSFNCNIRLTLSYCKAMFMSISENPQCLAEERAGFEKTAKKHGQKSGRKDPRTFLPYGYDRAGRGLCQSRVVPPGAYRTGRQRFETRVSPGSSSRRTAASAISSMGWTMVEQL